MSRASTKILEQAAARCRRFRARRKTVAVSPEVQATLRTALERTRTYRGQEAIESVKLPFHGPGADAYGPNGEQRFRTRRAYVEAGRRNGMRWQ